MTCKLQTFRKDPDEILKYGFDWSDWLDSGVTISTSTWTVPDGLTSESGGEETGVDSTTVLISGGTDGSSYTVTNTIETSDGQTGERSFIILVTER